MQMVAASAGADHARVAVRVVDATDDSADAGVRLGGAVDAQAGVLAADGPAVRCGGLFEGFEGGGGVHAPYYIPLRATVNYRSSGNRRARKPDERSVRGLTRCAQRSILRSMPCDGTRGGRAEMATTFQRTGHYTPMWRRVGTCHVYPINEATSEAVCQLTWAYSILDKPNVKF